MKKNTNAQLLDAGLEFFRINNFCWNLRERKEIGKPTYFLAQEDVLANVREILLTFTQHQGQISDLTTIRLSTGVPEDPETFIAFCAFLIFADYGVLMNEERSPIFLEKIEETKEIFLQSDFLKNEENNTKGTYHTLIQCLVKTKSMADEFIKKEKTRLQKRDLEGDEWKNQ